MTKTKWFWGLALGTVLALAAREAQAGHYYSGGSYGSWGSSGGSYGSQGSSGGSYGSYGSSGGSYGSSGGHHHHHHHHSHGSSGSYGSSGGSSGSHGSMGSSGGSYGSQGSSGTATTSYQPTAPTPVVADDRGHLMLSVPSDAIVYLVDQRMTMTGPVRRYAVPGLEAGRQYRYPIRVEVVRNGVLFRGVTEPRIQAGQKLELAFREDANQRQIVVAQK